jgi:hypothetical protein
MERERQGGWVYIMADRYRGTINVSVTSHLAGSLQVNSLADLNLQFRQPLDLRQHPVAADQRADAGGRAGEDQVAGG